jgi:hypothetical protein
MKKFAVKQITWYAIAALFVAVAILPILKSSMPQFFPEGFRDVDCQGMTCPEGTFCQRKQCIPIATRYPNAVPTGDV